MKGYLRAASICLLATVFATGCQSLDSGSTVESRPSASEAVGTLATILNVELEACESRIPAVAQESVTTFSEDRIKKTLHGVWKGRVSGEYDEKFLAEDGYLNVDYYMVVDTERSEVLVIEQFSDERSAPEASAELRAAGKLPVWSYLMCGKEQYKPAHPRQIHEFQKVSNDTDDARGLLGNSTGLRIADADFKERGLVISDAWEQLVAGQYFDNRRFPAYAGGLFKPFEIRNKVNDRGVGVFEMRFDTELRGGGGTAAEFESGVPIHGWETGQFVGVSTGSGDFLIASASNGAEWKKVSTSGGIIDVFFEKVVIGPLAE